MTDKIKALEAEVASYLITDAATREAFRLRFLAKKGEIMTLFDEFKALPNEEKRVVGALLNKLKTAAEEKFKATESLSVKAESADGFDFTRPAMASFNGSLHPLNQVRSLLIDVFSRLGFEIATGPEIEDDWHNFTALNMPEDHPARDMQDTFFVQTDPAVVLRTHTSPVQIRTMLAQKPPIRIIAPGRVYRCDSDATHSPVFHQIEGLYIAKEVSFADLKQVLFTFVREIFGEGLGIRFRPSFFPFTEPSAEMDIEWVKNGESSWMEILGCGMIDPNVLINCGIDPEEYSGYAFGLGVERIAMLKYGIRDIRLFYENDVRFLSQFEAGAV
jgi:phenylalanyl-tRNA synthetase alpha chain